MESKVQTLFLVISQYWISGTDAVKLDISRSHPASSSGVAFYILRSSSLSSDICSSHVRLQELPRPGWLLSSGSPSFTVKRLLLFCLLSQPLFRCSPAARRLMGQEKEEFAFQICYQPAGWKSAKSYWWCQYWRAGEENSINRGQRKTVIIAGSFRRKVTFVHHVSSLSEFSKHL